MPEAFQRTAYCLYQGFWTGLDWIFPPVCGGCGKPGERWCSDCHSKTTKLSGPACLRCGQPLADSRLCYRCVNSPPSFTFLQSWALFGGPLRNAIHRLKYYGDIALGEILSRPLIEIIHALDWQVDAVVPVPSGIARKRERGYNQAAIIGFPIALGCGIPFRPGWLVKTRETASQVGLTALERHNNLHGAFSSQQQYVQGKNVLIVDDVTTSGATMEACSSALVKAGAAKTYGLTLARSGNQFAEATQASNIW